MKKRFSLMALAIIFVVSCKKISSENIGQIPERISYKDTISFSINDQKYVFDYVSSNAIGNRAINVKPYETIINDGKLAYQTANYYWYGEKDSTLYSVSYVLESKRVGDSFKIIFTKKYKDTDLQRGFQLYAPKNHLDMFKTGKQSFAIDLDKANTTEGFFIDFTSTDLPGSLNTGIPGFSILKRSNLDKDIQKNSTFEISKIEKIRDNIYTIEAKFELNLFDIHEQLYRVKNGFLRITTSMTMPSDMGII
jgi:hypothetical protein